MSEDMAQGVACPRVLVGVDGSADGLRAVAYARRYAQAERSDLWIVNVVDVEAPVGGLWELVSTPAMLREAGEAKIAEALEVVTRGGFPPERVKAEVLLGRPGSVLAELSGTAELMVVGRRSIRGLERMFVGSTSLSAALHARCPVIVVSAASTPHVTGGFRVVAVAVSSWPIHGSAVEWGVREAVLRGARLRVVHVVPEVLGVEGAAFVTAATAGLENQLAQVRAEHPDVPVSIEVHLGEAVDALVGVSKEVDLLIIGAHHERAALGGLIRGVMAHAHCPVGVTR